jgi:hypothetical protein
MLIDWLGDALAGPNISTEEFASAVAETWRLVCVAADSPRCLRIDHCNATHLHELNARVLAALESGEWDLQLIGASVSGEVACEFVRTVIFHTLPTLDEANASCDPPSNSPSDWELAIRLSAPGSTDQEFLQTFRAAYTQMGDFERIRCEPVAEAVAAGDVRDYTSFLTRLNSQAPAVNVLAAVADAWRLRCVERAEKCLPRGDADPYLNAKIAYAMESENATNLDELANRLLVHERTPVEDVVSAVLYGGKFAFHGEKGMERIVRLPIGSALLWWTIVVASGAAVAVFWR